MGNHALGRTIGIAVQAAYERRQPGEKAIDILDRFCMGRSGDAEWEAEDPLHPGNIHPNYADYTDPTPEAGLGMLMVEAFSPNGLADISLYAGVLGYMQVGDPKMDAGLECEAEKSIDLWWRQVYDPFKARYGFW